MRANILSQVLAPVWNEAAGKVNGGGTPVLSGVIRYNLKFRKSDIAGRLAGGQFTNYASTAGRFGNLRLSANAKRVRMVTNFGIASYGAAIKAVAMGHRQPGALVQAVLTGRAENLPANYLQGSKEPLGSKETELLQGLGMAITEVATLTQVSPSPVSIEEFCTRPENLDLAGVCK